MDFFRTVFQTVAVAKGAIGAAVVLFVAGAAVGALFPHVSEPFVASLQAMARELAGRPTADLALQIFLRNAIAAVVAIVGGIGLGVVPVFAAFGNGLLAGAVLTLVPAEAWKVLPHGVFELPAVFAAWGLGLWIGQWPFGPDRLRRLGRRLLAAARVLLGLILPLLVVAAFVEAIAAIHIYRWG